LRLCNWLFQLLRFFNTRITVPYIGQQTWITLDPSDSVEKIILQSGLYEPEVWDTLQAHAEDGDVFWDIGSHIGGVAIRAALNPYIRQVACFEPSPENFSALKMNANLNPSLNLLLFNLALSDRTGPAELSAGTGQNRGQNTLAHQQPGEELVTVVCSTIDEIIKQGDADNPQLMKIDVEGWESHVLNGGEKLFRNSPPRTVVFENSYSKNRDGSITPDIGPFFCDHGYDVHHIPRPTGGTDLYENFVALLCQ
jgi:FkbM family methyltransferase